MTYLIDLILRLSIVSLVTCCNANPRIFSAIQQARHFKRQKLDWNIHPDPFSFFFFFFLSLSFFFFSFFFPHDHRPPPPKPWAWENTFSWPVNHESAAGAIQQECQAASQVFELCHVAKWTDHLDNKVKPALERLVTGKKPAEIKPPKKKNNLHIENY